MGEQDLDFREPVKNPAPHDTRSGHGRIEGVSDKVPEIVVLQPVMHAEDIEGMNKNRTSRATTLAQKHIEGGVIEIPSYHVGADLDADEPQAHRALQLLCTGLRVLKRNRGHGGKTYPHIFAVPASTRSGTRQFPVHFLFKGVVHASGADRNNLPFHPRASMSLNRQSIRDIAWETGQTVVRLGSWTWPRLPPIFQPFRRRLTNRTSRRTLSKKTL